MADIPTLPRVSLETICSTSLAAQSSSYERAVETLAVSIAKYHCAVISTSDRLALGQHNLWQVLQAPRSRRASLLPGGGQSELVTVAYDPKLRRDTLNARIAGSNAIDDDAATQELSESYKQVRKVVVIIVRYTSRVCLLFATLLHVLSCSSSLHTQQSQRCADFLSVGRHCTHRASCNVSLMPAAIALRHIFPHA